MVEVSTPFSNNYEEHKERCEALLAEVKAKRAELDRLEDQLFVAGLHLEKLAALSNSGRTDG